MHKSFYIKNIIFIFYAVKNIESVEKKLGIGFFGYGKDRLSGPGFYFNIYFLRYILTLNIEKRKYKCL